MECTYCPRRCLLQNDRPGACGAYGAEKGKITEKHPHRWTVMYATHIESVPFYHAYPGSRSFLLGSSSCNLTRILLNAYVAKEIQPSYAFDLPPAKVVTWWGKQAAITSSSASMSRWYRCLPAGAGRKRKEQYSHGLPD